MSTIAFVLPNNNNYAPMFNMFMNTVFTKFPKLTANGITLDDNYDFSQGVHNIGKGSVIVISSENVYDIDWYATKKDAERDGVRVMYNLEDDYNTIVRFLKSYYEDKFSNRSFHTSYSIGSNKSIFDSQAYRRIDDKVYAKVPRASRESNYEFRNSSVYKVTVTPIFRSIPEPTVIRVTGFGIRF